MQKILPKRLKSGDTVGLTAPSSYLRNEKRELLENSVQVLESYGLRVERGQTLTNVDQYGISAGSAEERASEINDFFKNQKINALWCVQGGNTANQTLELLDYEAIKHNPKPFIGLSDNTVLINAIQHETGLVTFHGTDLKKGKKNEYFDSTYSHQEFKNRLMDGQVGPVAKNSKWKTVRGGKAKGPLFGGNINCFLKLTATPYWPDLTGAILMLEGYNLPAENAIYKTTHLRQMGVFDQIVGVIVGDVYSFDQEEQTIPEGKKVLFEDILLAETEKYSFPILKMYEFGHKCPSTVLPIGCEAEVNADSLELTLTEPCVS